jgi:hypothetical protein
MTAMGRKKQVNALSKCYSLKVSEELFNSIQSLSKADKAKFNTIVRELAHKFIIKVYQNNSVENKSLPKKITVTQTKNKSLPKKQTEKSLYEQYKEDKAREDYNKSIYRLFEKGSEQ